MYDLKFRQLEVDSDSSDSSLEENECSTYIHNYFGEQGIDPDELTQRLQKVVDAPRPGSSCTYLSSDWVSSPDKMFLEESPTEQSDADIDPKLDGLGTHRNSFQGFDGFYSQKWFVDNKLLKRSKSIASSKFSTLKQEAELDPANEKLLEDVFTGAVECPKLDVSPHAKPFGLDWQANHNDSKTLLAILSSKIETDTHIKNEQKQMISMLHSSLADLVTHVEDFKNEEEARKLELLEQRRRDISYIQLQTGEMRDLRRRLHAKVTATDGTVVAGEVVIDDGEIEDVIGKNVVHEKENSRPIDDDEGLQIDLVGDKNDPTALRYKKYTEAEPGTKNVDADDNTDEPIMCSP